MKPIKTKSLNKVNKKKIAKIMGQMFKIKKYHLKNPVLMTTNHYLAKIPTILKPRDLHL